MADISKITLPNGNTYNIKDSWARGEIEALEAIDNGVSLAGVTTTVLADGGTTSSIQVNGSTYTPVKGDLIFAPTESGSTSTKEFLFDGEKWHLLDALNTYGDLATKNTVNVKYDKASVNAKTFTGTAVRLVTGDIPIPATYTSTFTGEEGDISVSGTVVGTVSTTTATTENKTATVSSTTGTATYTPAGTVSIPTISVKTAGSTTDIIPPTAVSVVNALASAAPGTTAPANAITYYSVIDETLSLYQIGATKTNSVTFNNSNKVTVKTGDAAYQSNQPTFTGTGVRLVTGNIAVPKTYDSTFTGSGENTTLTGKFTPIGHVDTQTATTENKTATVSKAASGSATFTPEGTINVTLTQTQTNATVSYS